MLSFKEYREPTHRLPDYLPWAALVAPGVVLQKEHILQKTVAFRGPDLASSSSSELMSAVGRLNNALKRLGSGWAFFIEAQRFECSEYPTSRWPSPAAWLVEVERRNRFREAGAHYESGYYLTFVWKMPTTQTKKAAAVFYDDPERRDSHQENDRDLEYFQKQVQEVVDIMQGVFAAVDELDDDETLSYLHSTISTNRHPVQAPDVPMYLDALLPDMAFTPGDIPMLGDHFVPTITINGFPSTSLPGLLDELNHLQIEYRWVVRFIAMDKEDAKKEISKYRKRWWQKRKNLWTLLKEEASQQESALIDTDAANKAADADAAMQLVGDDAVSFGFFTATVTVWDQDLDAARQKMTRVKQAIQSRGFAVKDETLNSKQAWLGSLPGHVYANVRRPLIHTLNLAHIMPLSAIWAGSTENAHLKEKFGVGTPHMICSTTGDTPFRFNQNVGDVGHLLMVGPTGSGKSTLLNLMELQWLRYPNAQVIIFDKDRSARGTTLAAGGKYYEPGNEDAPVAYQPLAHIDRPGERVWAAQFILNMLRLQNVQETPALKKLVDEALVNMVSTEKHHRTMTVFSDLVQSTDVRAALRPYTMEGNYGQMFDADHDDLQDSSWLMFEMGRVMDMGEEAIIPTLDYLFHRTEQRFGNGPTLMVIDEGWLFLAHPVFAPRLQSWLKTLRKKDVYVVFATQEPADAADSSIMSSILSACHTKIYLPDEEALTPAMAETYARFGLSETEISILARSQKKRDYYYRSVLGRRLFNLNLGPAALAMVGLSSEADHKFMDKMEKELPPEKFLPALLQYRGLDWAVDLVNATQGETPLMS